jgi:hypothetical protein
MRLAALLPFLTLVTLLLRAQPPAPKPGSVEGIVVNSASGIPIKQLTTSPPRATQAGVFISIASSRAFTSSVPSATPT